MTTDPAAPDASSLRDLDLELLDALIAGDHEVAARFSLQVEPGYLAFPEALAAMRNLMREGRMLPPWGSCLFITARRLVGLGGYKGPPDADGGVEIGYSIAPGCRGRGYATRAAGLLVTRAFAGGVRIVRAHTLAEPSASTRVLERCGFNHAGSLVDPEDGALWRWERRPG